MDISKLQDNMTQGFNTYSNESVLTHVLLPSGFSVSLGFKFYNTGTVLKTALIGEQDIHPGPRSYDGSYTELTLSCCDHEILVQSAADGGRQYLLVTPLVTFKNPPALLISAAVLWNRPGTVERKDNTLVASLPDQTISVYTDGKSMRELNAGMFGPYLSVALSGPVCVSTGAPMGADAAKELMQKSKERVQGELARYGALGETYNAMRTCLAWDTIYEPEKERICSTVSRIWNRGWCGYVLFCWDTCFAALMAAVENKDLAYANLIAILEEMTEDGFVPNFGAANDLKTRDRSQPPVGALTLKELYRKYRETSLIDALFDKLLTWNRWFAAHRLLENGQLCWGSDPYENKFDHHLGYLGVGERFGAALESGLDNSPMYDDMPFDEKTHLMCLADVGLTGLYIMDCESLAELAEVVGRPEAAELRARAAQCKDGLEQMWDEEFGMYLNRRTDTGELSRRISPTNFYALFSDRVRPERAERMIREHFFNEEEFFGEYMMASIAKNDPAYPDQNYWRGRIWAPMNYLAYLAMRKHGLSDACAVLAEKSKQLLLREWNLYGHVHENYHGGTGMGCGVENSDKFYHWGALLSLIALMEEGYVAGPEEPL